MPWIGLIWIVIFIVRLVLREDNIPAVNAMTASGKVHGHRGPNMRAFSGRAGRREWWIVSIWSWVVGGFIAAVPVVGPLLSAPWLISSFAVTTRRLHDMRRSGWLQVIPIVFALACFAGYAGWRVFVAHGQLNGGLLNQQDEVSGYVMGAAIGVYLIFYALMGLLPGNNGANCYGEADPA